MRYFLLNILLFSLSSLGILVFFSNGFNFLVGPLEFYTYRSAQSILGVRDFFKSVESLRSENALLKQEVASLSDSVSNCQSIYDENTVLKKQFNILSPIDNKKIIVSKIMTSSIGSTSSTFVLNVGESSGVKTGSILTVGSNLIGVVTSVEWGRSFGRFITSPDVTISVKNVSMENKTEALARGDFGSSVLLDRILPTEPIKVGDLIATSGKDGVFPPDLVVGKVVHVSEITSESLKSARVTTLLDFGKLTQVIVLLP